MHNNNRRSDMQPGVYHTVQDIHDPLSEGITTVPYIAQSSDDGFQWPGGGVDRGSSYLRVAIDDDKVSQAGIRFSNVLVPHGAVIKSAKLEFSSETDETSTPTFDVYGISHVNPDTFLPHLNSIGSRPLTRASTAWTLSPWNKRDEFGDEMRYAVDVKDIVSEVTAKAGWCGGNAMGFVIKGNTGGDEGKRLISSYNSDRTEPSLIIDYEYDWENPSAFPGTGCQLITVNRTLATGDEDAQEFSYDTRLNENYLYLANGDVGLRYLNLPLAKGASIEEAYIEFTASENSSQRFATHIRAHDVGNSEGFTRHKDSIVSRQRTPAGAWWPIYDDWWGKGKVYRTPNLARVIQEVVARADWKPGNPLSLIVTRAGDHSKDRVHPNQRGVYSRNNSIVHSPRLVLKVQHQSLDDTNGITVKDRLVSHVSALSSRSGTPTVYMLTKAQEYFSSQATTPITNSCQANHIILLSDGEPNSMNKTIADRVTGLTGKACTNSRDMADHMQCGRNLTEYMETTNQRPSLGGDTTITTHTIAYASGGDAKDFLKGIASPRGKDGKRFYEANNANDLLKAFDSIIQEILSNEASFVAPSVSVNQYRSYQHNNELYYALFTPEKTTNWSGNLKKYQLAARQDKTSGQVTYYLADANGKEAVNPETGSFISSSRSFWSANDDGGSTRAGGAAFQLPLPEERLLVTDIGASRDSVLKEQRVEPGNTSITKAVLGHTGMDDAERREIIRWAMGYNAAGTKPRKQIGDPLHSQPAMIYYGCRNGHYKDSDNKKAGCRTSADDLISIVFGTNQGIFHAINGQNGKEQFAFFPEELMPNLRRFKNNDSLENSVTRTYGIDGSPTIWRHDADSDGAITIPPKPGKKPDHVYAYFGLRRGGSSYYALDITDINNPKYLWRIDSSKAGFEEMGQSWSKPKLTSLMVGKTPTKVLIFGAGYDTTSNDKEGGVRTPDSTANAVYIVDAKTGKLLWKATANSNATAGNKGMLVLPKMKYSIPGDIAAIDLNLDGQANQLVFADMGGQVWRLFIDNEASYHSGKLHVEPFGGIGRDKNDIEKAGGVVADISGTYNRNNRRFYMRPVMGITKAGDRDMFTIAIGSGHRAKPLSTVVKDRIYVLKSAAIFNNPKPEERTVTTLTEKDLYDATSDDISSDNEIKRDDAKMRLSLSSLGANGNLDFQSDGGWYITMEEPGEKILSDISLINGNISFVSYEPRAASNSCNPVIGVNRFYRVNVSDASAAGESRSEEIKNTGIISSTRFVVMDSSELAGDLEDIEGLVPVECVGTTCIATDQDSTIFPTGWMDRVVNRKASASKDSGTDTEDSQ
ncbi:pilus assembly protein [Sansalvadorimonas verongulae]|uniref:pilus assembly protein n=1 Tax=Sansalvadorimonas verongulae TaxID=2172824 RepID=UPI0018AD2BA3|nr:PilC/PilY family type IV pilus protein [Sansalvadorimonas verongulae]